MQRDGGGRRRFFGLFGPRRQEPVATPVPVSLSAIAVATLAVNLTPLIQAAITRQPNRGAAAGKLTQVLRDVLSQIQEGCQRQNKLLSARGVRNDLDLGIVLSQLMQMKVSLAATLGQMAELLQLTNPLLPAVRITNEFSDVVLPSLPMGDDFPQGSNPRLPAVRRLKQDELRTLQVELLNAYRHLYAAARRTWQTLPPNRAATNEVLNSGVAAITNIVSWLEQETGEMLKTYGYPQAAPVTQPLTPGSSTPSQP